MKKSLTTILVMSCLITSLAYADAVTDNLAQKLKKLIPQEPKSITKSAIPGLYEANYGMQIY